MKREYGCYCCLKEDCNYIIHVNCAVEDKDLYYMVDSENQDEPIENFIESSITCVIEVNECGEATKIKQFSHEHCLSLEDTNRDDDDKHCDGCTLSVLDSFYSCLQCNFVLHKSCAEVPMKKHHWFDPCKTLNQIAFSNVMVVFNSAVVSSTIVMNVISHFASNVLQFRIPSHIQVMNIPSFKIANIKGNALLVVLRFIMHTDICKDCNSALHFECITLPHVARHKCDKRFIELSYHDGNDDPEQHYCDICEERRDPNN
ncbi:uncharacterized protein LOC111297160 [Durio zibethinus]|uniref:Uncharacterized protein LOC111297160 n=1 Tax=Durio zibethinus TaxID=66656 RepID=A0A6P5Z5C2_DURZI|nr:uncharacterized protein LOC111297160 [Durio zibethinus]